MGLRGWQILLIRKKSCLCLPPLYPLPFILLPSPRRTYTLTILFEWKVERKQHTSYTHPAILGVEEQSSRAEPSLSEPAMLSLSGTCSASRRIWRSAPRGTVASPSGCQPTQAFSPPQPPPSLLPPSFPSSLSTPPPISSSFSHYKRLLMLKLSVTSAPTADMATLTVVQPLTLDRGKGAAHPSGHCVPSASPSAPASSHRDRQTRSGRGSRATRRSEEGFRAESRILSSPFLCPPRPPCPLHASLARHKGAFAGLWRPRRHSQPLAGSPPGRRLCWSGGAGIARRPPGARGWWGAGRKLAEPGEGACSRRPWKPGEWAACQPTLPGAWEEGSLSPRRGARAGQAAGARAAARRRTRRTPCDLCRGARRLDCRGGELTSAERATRRAGSRAAAGGAASRQPCPALPGFALWRRQGSRLPPPPAALRQWQLTVCPAPASLVLSQPCATAVPGLRKALGRSAGWVEIQLLTSDPVRSALWLDWGSNVCFLPRPSPSLRMETSAAISASPVHACGVIPVLCVFEFPFWLPTSSYECAESHDSAAEDTSSWSAEAGFRTMGGHLEMVCSDENDLVRCASKNILSSGLNWTVGQGKRASCCEYSEKARANLVRFLIWRDCGWL